MGELSLLKRQLEITRNNLFKAIGETSPEVISTQPEGFNNTIHWHVGHILMVGEQFFFGKNGQLPKNYLELFGNGSKPADWKGDVPSVDQLVDQLKDQLNRIKEIPDSKADEKLPREILGQNTFGELAALALYHESFHFGQIHAMKRVVETSLQKN